MRTTHSAVCSAMAPIARLHDHRRGQNANTTYICGISSRYHRCPNPVPNWYETAAGVARSVPVSRSNTRNTGTHASQGMSVRAARRRMNCSPRSRPLYWYPSRMPVSTMNAGTEKRVIELTPPNVDAGPHADE